MNCIITAIRPPFIIEGISMDFLSPTDLTGISIYKKYGFNSKGQQISSTTREHYCVSKNEDVIITLK